jgi:G8 domain
MKTLRCKLVLEILEARFMLSAGCPTDPLSVKECAYAVKTFTPTPANLALTGTTLLAAVRSGDYADPSTWGGRVPDGNTWAVIAHNFTVSVREADQSRIITVYGGLAFAPNVETSLTVDTIFTASADDGGPGYLQIGTQAAPVTAQCHIVFTDTGPINRQWDPEALSRGLVAHGITSIYGAAVTPYTATSVVAGSTSADFTNVSAWRVGDVLEFAGNLYGTSETDTIVGISGEVVTLGSPLKFDHLSISGQQPLVADLNRNITFSSANTSGDPQRGAHVMFMHSDMVEIQYAAFDNLGRTDKSTPINDAVLDSSGGLLPGTGTNERGRYALHFHRCYGFLPGNPNYGDPPIQVVGVVAVGGPGWGLANHSSDVNFSDCVDVGAFGAGLVTEAGDEAGRFTYCVSINNHGTGSLNFNRVADGDWGFNGMGIWMQSPGVSLTNDMTFDGTIGTALYTIGLVVPGRPQVKFVVAGTQYAPYFPGKFSVAVQLIPEAPFTNDSSFGCQVGLDVRFDLAISTNGLTSTLSNFTAANIIQTGVNQEEWDGNCTLKNFTLIGLPGSGQGIQTNPAYNQNDFYANCSVSGFTSGLLVPSEGTDGINGGYWDDTYAFSIPQALVDDFVERTLAFTGNITFGPHVQLEYQMLAPFWNTIDPERLFQPDHITLPNGQQLYWSNEAASHILYPVGQSAFYVPAALQGLTNQQLWDQYGIAGEGQIAPSDAAASSITNGLVGSVTVEPVCYKLESASGTTPSVVPVGSYYPHYLVINAIGVEQLVTSTERLNVVSGWQVVTITDSSGQKHSFIVDGVAA